MTPTERSLVIDLFDRLAEAENAERDPEAERVIRDGLRRAPNAVYTLVQTVLVQDDALKRADARIRDFETQLDQEPQRPRSGSFLGMREAPTERRGSGPTAPPRDEPAAAGADYRGPSSQPMSAGPGSSKPGGSFLGTAAAAAAGMIGGSLMLDSIRGMLGSRQGAGGLGSTLLASGSGSRGAGAVAGGRDAARESGHDDARSGDEDGSSHDNEEFDAADDQDRDDDQHHEDFDDGSEDFDDPGDFDDDGGDFGGDDEA